ncbi:MAG: methyltransferase domain-containing protein [Myxococcota bacterium]
MDTHESVREYYGNVLKGSKDLKTNACCVVESPPSWLRPLLGHINEEVSNRFYGCGFPIAEAVKGATVLDLGCGTGRDVYLFSQLVGPDGFVHGIDMTPEQLKVANDTVGWHMDRFGYSKPNVAFHQGFIEELKPIESNSVDLVISNCVLNLSPRKDLVLAEVHRVLKPGGEFLFSDVFADRRLPAWMAQDQELLGECLGGALYVGDFTSLSKKSGFLDPRCLTSSVLEVQNESIQKKLGAARFGSETYRLFKLDGLDDRCEDYGQVAVYKEEIPHLGPLFKLDDHHLFELNRPERVCGNTAAMLRDTRFGAHFEVIGDQRVHYGLFECGETMAAAQYAKSEGGAASAASCC